MLDLFTGSGSVARAAAELGYEVLTLDCDPRCKPDICANVLDFNFREAFSPGYFDVVWASCPCETFSCARKCNIGRCVKGAVMTAETLKHDRETRGVPILRKTQEIIEYLQPKTWFIENPYTGCMKDYIKQEPYIFDYCMFGFGYRKRTAIWSNKHLTSTLCDRSHLIDGRHAMTAIGTSKTHVGQGGGSSRNARYAIPKDLIVLLLARDQS